MRKLFFLLLFTGFGVGIQAQTLKDAQAAIEAEKFDQAKNILQTLVNNNPDDGQYLFHLGNIYLTLGEDALAKASFEKGVLAKKNGQLNFIGLGRILLDDGNPDAAAAEFEKAMYKMKKKDTDIYLYIARAYFDSFHPDYEKAAAFAQRVISVTPAKAAAYLVLGDAQYKLGNQNEAYMAYRSAYNFDNTLLRGKLNLAIITKDAHALPEAVATLEEIIAIDPTYGPTYRELAEVYYMWGNMDAALHEEYIAKALRYYEQYMDNTDYSLDSRMRHADFLVLAKDYEALEKEALEMQKIDKVNPRILRYLGYSAYENRNYTEAIDALTQFLSVVDPRRAIGFDYAYLAKAQVQLIMAEGLEPLNVERFREMLSILESAIEKDAPIENEFYDLGVALYKTRQYGFASEVFGTLIKMETPRLIDMLYYANSVFYYIANMEEQEQLRHQEELRHADEVYGQIIELSPTTPDPYYNRARLNRYIVGADERVVELFQAYISVIESKGEEEMSKPLTRRKLSEAYVSLGAHFSDTDRNKALEFFQRAVEFDPENEDAIIRINYLKGH